MDDKLGEPNCICEDHNSLRIRLKSYVYLIKSKNEETSGLLSFLLDFSFQHDNFTQTVSIFSLLGLCRSC